MTATDRPVVLIVDDNEGFVRAQADYLGTFYDVRTAESGDAGIDAFGDHVDVVLLDRAMPDVTGDEVAAAIRDQNGDAQVLMTTAVDPDIDIIDLEIDDYLRKPVSGDELRQHIEMALDRLGFSDPVQGFFSLANKRDVLADQPEARHTEQFLELDELVDELAREHVERREDQFQTLVQFAPVAIITLDEEGRVASWNPAATELFGWDADEVEGEEPPMFAGESQAQLDYARSQLFRETIVSDLDVVCTTKEGSSIDVSLSAAPLTSSDGMYGTLFVFLDITERKQRAQQVTVMNRVLRHNVRNELNLLMGWLTELDRQVSGETQEYVDKALEAARGIDDIANKARSIQHILAEDRSVVELDLVALTIEAIERARETFPDATVEADLPDSAPIIAHPDLDQAIWEVLENAVVHNDDPEPRVQVAITTDDRGEERRRLLTIADDGPGIPAEERRIIFEEAEGQLEHGSGLGLWYLKWLLERSDATLAFEESHYDRGSAVTMGFRVPGDAT